MQKQIQWMVVDKIIELYILKIMKINFDELLNEEIPIPIDKNILNTTLPSRDYSETDFTPSTAIHTNDFSPSTHRQYMPDEKEAFERIFELKMALALQSENYQDARTVHLQRKKTKQVDIRELTNKVYNPPPCSKKHCKQYQFQKNVRSIQDEWIGRQKRYKPSSKILGNKSTQFSVHERLNNYGKLYQRRKQSVIYQNSMTKSQFQGNQSYRSKLYLKKYVPFYQRLDHQVRKSKQKRNFYQKNPHYLQGSAKKYFEPTLFSSKYKDIQSRYSLDSNNSSENWYNKRSKKDLMNYESLNTSIMTVMSLDKSIELVNSIQQYFFEKMKCIFSSNDSKYITVTEQKILLLTDIQFKIMQPFVNFLEENRVTVRQFQEQLSQYYQNLDFRDKQELRAHQIKAKKISKAVKNKKNPSFILVQPKTAISGSVKSSNYHHLLRTYV